MSEKMKIFYVDLTEDGDLIVRQETEDFEDPVVSDKYKTKFLLCSARCVREKHVGTFENNTFKCIYFKLPATYPYDILKAWIIIDDEGTIGLLTEEEWFRAVERTEEAIIKLIRKAEEEKRKASE